MQLPESAPTFLELWKGFVTGLPQLLPLEVMGLESEVKGEYLHWDELQRRQPPKGLNHRQWWLGLSIARRAVRTELPLHSIERGVRFWFARTETLYRRLHDIDRRMGARLEVTAPALKNESVREHYVLRSLAEEAINSSQLEGASTTRKVAKDMLLSGRPPVTLGERMIANNFAAMALLKERKDEPLSIRLILDLHRMLTRDTLEPKDVGRLRLPEETVSVHDRASGTVLHLPPGAEELPGRLEALCAFANADEDDIFTHPVVRAVLLHFMLAYDHPFVDGNGRTARALFYWYLLHRSHWIGEFLSISRVIQQAPTRYGRAFLHTEADHGDVTYFVLHQLGVLKKAIDDLDAYLARKAQEIRETEKLLKRTGRFNYRQEQVLAHALRHPDAQYTIAAHRRDHGVVYETARSDLLDLARAGYLKKVSAGRKFVFTPGRTLKRPRR